MVKIPRRTFLAISVSLVVVGCGGGGGGGGYVNNNGGATGSVTRLGTIKPLSGNTTTTYESGLNAHDLDRGGGDELIIVSRANLPDGTTPANWKDADVSIWGWQGGTLVDKSNQWFTAGVSRTVLGAEDEVKIGDFDGDGHRDMYVGPNTDIASVRAGINGANTGAIFFNSGASSFNQRVDISLGATASAHASAVADLNGDGIDDIWSTQNANSVIILGSNTRNITYLSAAGMPQAGGASVAIADFTAVGTKTVILGDQGSAPSPNNLYSYSIDLANNQVNLTHLGALPAPRFTLPKWSGYGFGAGSHEIRILADIQLTTGKVASSQGVVSDAVIFSRPNQYANGQWPEYQEVQFLLNNGTGTFTDITDTVLKGFNTNGHASYNPSFRDVNGDGRLDILVTGNNWSSNQGAQILIWRAAANAYGFEYQSSYGVMLKALQDNALNTEKSLNANAAPGANGFALVQDPSGNYYIATAVDFTSGGTKYKAIYMTPFNSITPAATLAALRANWPWLTDSQIQTILAQSTTTYFGMNLLDPNRALNPQGMLSMPTTSGLRPITGAIGGVKLNDTISSLRIQDGFGRAFQMDYSPTRMDMLNSWAAQLDDRDDSTRTLSMVADLQLGESHGFRYGASADNRNRIFGMPNYQLSDNLSATWQFTNMSRSPWMNISGSWGKIKASTTTEATVTWRHQGWRTRGGIMHTTTHIEPGLVTRVNPITSVWTDISYNVNEWTISGGTLPKIVSGSAELTLPTGVDTQGRIQYTNIKAGFDNPLKGFLRLGYQGLISKKVLLNSAAMISGRDSYAIKMEIKSQW